MRIAWNKGKKTGLVPKTAFKIGSHSNAKTEFKKGMVPWNKGKSNLWKHSDEWKKRQSIKLKEQWANGKRKGYKLTKEHKEKLSLAIKGRKIPKKGHLITSETRLKIGKSNKGKVRSELFKANARKVLMREVMKFQKGKPTSIEKKVCKELENRGFLFETQILINNKFLVDIYIKKLNLIIEADGDYWHTLERIVKKDKAENAYLTKCGYQLLRLREKDIKDNSFLQSLPIK